ncbi:MAG: tail fiber domain-containing protein, partial [Casimicrobiaceae bacterium]
VGGGGGLPGAGTPNFVAKWMPRGAPLGDSQIFDDGSSVGIGTASPRNKLQVGVTPGFSGNQLALGNGTQAMSFSLSAQTPLSAVWFTNTNFALMPAGGSGFVGIGRTDPTHHIDILGVNPQINLQNSVSNATATISRFTNRLEVSPSDGFQISVGGLARPHFWVGANGNVGVATTSPASRLQVGSVGTTGYAANDIAFGNGVQASGITQKGDVAQWFSTTNIALMPQGNGQGSVGINTTSPFFPLDVRGYYRFGAFSYAYLKTGFNLNAVVDVCRSCNALVSIRADQNVLAAEFDAQSDARIKDIVGISNSARDLATINALQVTDYTLKDKVKTGDKSFKKVIAQQVETVYPQVVSKHTDFIPNVYKLASSFRNNAGGILLHFDDGHRLSGGAKWINLLASGDHAMQRVGIVSIPSDKDVVVDARHLNGDRVFVYGEEVDDFRTVDYDGLSALNISATQELTKQLARQRADMASLVAGKDAQLADLRGHLDEQRSRIAELEGFAGEMAQIRAQLAALKRIAAPAQMQEAVLRP